MQEDLELEHLRAAGKNEVEANKSLSSIERLQNIIPIGKAFGIEKVVSVDGRLKQLFKARKSDWIHNFIYLDGKKFDFSGRNYLRQIYDAPYTRKLLKTGRQVEKCVSHRAKILLSDGKEKAACDVITGDVLGGMDSHGRFISNRVVHSESNGDKQCLRIITRLGSTLEVTLNHPLRKLLSWEIAENLVVGDKIASLRRQGEFYSVYEPLAALVGLLFGDGCFSSDGSTRQRDIQFSCANLEIRKWFEELIEKADNKTPAFYDKDSINRNYRINIKSAIGAWLDRHNLYGMKSATKVLPEIVFRYDKVSTRELLRGLWATDGHCKNVSDSKVDLVYCSTSEKLIGQVRTLLRKFGVITTLRTYKPKNGQLAYIIRVVTRKSIEKFHNEIGPIPGKPFSIQEADSNSNLDTLPKEVYTLIKAAKVWAGYGSNRWSGKCLEKEIGFRYHSKYCPTFEKVALAQSVLKDNAIQTVLDSDIIWDEIVSIKNIGARPTWAIQTETETFISDFIVNHNTTMLANEFIINSIVHSYFKSLYVSPSHNQTRAFSNQKLKPWIEDSPWINKFFQSSAVSRQVFERSFTNGSIGFLRSAFLNADRTRGLSADELFVDELQDILLGNIPVIEETLSHSNYGYEIFSGTPKTLENTIEQYWERSSQCEWLVPCFAHSPVKWNFLDEKNIGKHGLICNKCGKSIDATKGKWYAFSNETYWMGFRISQLMVPWFGNELKWKQLVEKYETYSESNFKNEVLGISHDSASKPISRSELVACCSSLYPFRHKPDQFTNRLEIFAGVDWGEGTDGSELNEKGRVKVCSYTVISLGAYIAPGLFHIFFYKRFTGTEVAPSACIADVTRIMRAFRVKCAGVDYGFGWGVNEQLEEIFGRQRIIKFQYVGMQRERKKYDDIGIKYQLGRTEVMSDFFADIKKNKIIWPEWENVKDYLCDIEHVYAEYNDKTRAVRFDHKASEPDDAMHASILCREAADNYYGLNR